MRFADGLVSFLVSPSLEGVLSENRLSLTGPVAHLVVEPTTDTEMC